MPWKAVGKKIVRADTGKIVGTSTSHEKAEASVRARYANMNPRDKAIMEYNKRKTKEAGPSLGCGEEC